MTDFTTEIDASDVKYPYVLDQKAHRILNPQERKEIPVLCSKWQVVKCSWFLVCRMLTEDDTVRIYHNLENARVYHGRDPQYIDISAEVLYS